MRKLTSHQFDKIASASIATPPAWQLAIFADTNDKLKHKDSAGVVREYSTLDGTETLTNKTLTTPVINGAPTWTGVSNPATGNTLVLRNSDGDIRNLKYTTSITSTTTSGWTLALSNASAGVQRFTGTANHTVTLWSNSVVSVSTLCTIINESTWIITVQTSTGAALWTVAAWQVSIFRSVTTGNTAADWRRFDNISLTTTGTSGAATLSNGVLNIPNYATGWGGGLKLPTYTVGASWADYTTIQAAIDAATTGGLIYVIDGTYTLTSQLLFKYANTRIIGNGYSTKIQGDCATVTTLIWFNASNLSGCSLENFYIANTNWTTQGIGLNFSNTPLCNFKNLHFYNLGTAIRANDTANFTFYNRFEDIKIFECTNWLDFTSTNPFNDNEFSNVRVALKAWGTGKWLYMNNAQGNTFHNCNFEPTSGNTGIHLDTNLVVNTTFYDVYIEGNTTGINITSAQRTTFIGGMIVANTTNVTDTWIDTAYLNTNVNYVLYNQLANVVARDLSNASRKAIDIYNNTSFAHTGGQLVKAELLNATDTSNVLEIANAWSGSSLVLTGDSPRVKFVWVTTEPWTPSSWTWYMYAKSIAWKVVPKWKWPSWLDFPLQFSFWQNNITMWNSTTATAWVWLWTAGAGAGTYTTALPTTTNLYTATKRGRWANVVTTTNQVLGQRNTEAMYMRWWATGQGGFFFYTRCGFDVWTNGGRFFAGMHSGTTVISADPSALNNTVWFCVDAADNGAISFLTRGTVATKASTGFTITSNKGYDLFIFCAPNSSQYTWRIVDFVAWTEASGTATANLPTNTTLLTAWVLASNAALTTVTAIQLGVNKIYIETDY